MMRKHGRIVIIDAGPVPMLYVSPLAILYPQLLHARVHCDRHRH